LSQRLGGTVLQPAMASKSNEIPAAKERLAGLFLERRVLTMDAWLCQKEIAALIVEKGGTT
jgi:predicted transposase YbfD/YdcC